MIEFIKKKIAYIILLVLYFFFTLKYDNERGGYFMHKRIWVWLVFFPVLVLFDLVAGIAIIIADYFKDLTNYYCHYVITPKRQLTFKEKTAYIKHFISN